MTFINVSVSAQLTSANSHWSSCRPAKLHQQSILLAQQCGEPSPQDIIAAAPLTAKPRQPGNLFIEFLICRLMCSNAG